MKKIIWKYIKNYKFGSIFLKYLILFILIIFIVTGQVIYVYLYNDNQVIQHKMSDAYETSLNRVNYILDMVMKNVNRSGVTLANNTEVRRFMVAERVNDFSYDHRQIANMLDIIRKSEEAIHSIYIYSEKTNYIFSDTSGGSSKMFYDNKWIDDYRKNKESEQWFLDRTIYSELEKQNKRFISVFQNIKYYNETYGTVVINIDADYVKNNYLRADNNMSWAVFNQNGDEMFVVGNIRLHPSIINADENFDNNPISLIVKIDKVRCAVSYIKSSYTGWKIMVGSDVGMLQNNSKILSGLNIFVMIFGTSLLVVVFFLFKWIMNPLVDMLSMLQPKKKHIETMVVQENSYENEIEFIMDTMKDSIQKNTEIEIELQQKIKHLKAAQFTALQSQISPHFLANTLSGLYWFTLEKMGGANEISDALSTMSELIYITMSKTGHFWKIQTEIEHLEKFIKIQKFRFGDSVNVIVNVDPVLNECMFIRLILQPVVENAFKHGVANEKEGLIQIDGKLQDNDIVFEVYNNGKAITQKEIEEILFSEAELGKETYKHGLKNANYRIKLLFGENYGITAFAPQTGGTKIVIRVPKIDSQEENTQSLKERKI